jgi:CheY-like chemotaxis protein
MIVKESDSDPKKIRVVVSDITEQNDLEWRLRQAQKMEAIAKLAGGIAHQFNSALFVITAATELLELQVTKDKITSEYIASIKESTGRMTKLTRHLLAYARGRGMGEETKKRVFEPFFTTKFFGRGLGLAAAYGIVKNHDGSISIESQMDRGISVCIYLPTLSGVEEKKTQKPHGDPFKGIGTLLLIEDEPAVIEMLRKLLERLGFHVIEAQTGKEAIALARAFDGEIDLAILDVFLPDMNGNKIYPLIKEFRPGLKVLVFSGYSLDGPAQEILDAGAHGFLQKAVSIEILSQKLTELLQAR